MPRAPRPLPAVLSLVVLSLLAVLSACAAAPEAPAGPADLHGSWTVLAIEGTPAVAGPAEAVGVRLSLSFEADGSLSGYTGVNALRGSWSLDGDMLSLPPAATTKRAGPPMLMDQERQFLEALGRVAGFQRDADELLLADETGAELLRLEHADDR